MRAFLRLATLCVVVVQLAACAQAFQQYECDRRAQNRPDAAQRQAECQHPQPQRYPEQERHRKSG